MAINEPSAYGTDIRCVTDADAFWSAVTGVDVVYQDAYHRITTDDVIGPGGVGWGRDVRRLLGASARDLAGLAPVYAQVLQRDERIQSAAVTITATRRGAFSDVRFEAICYTAAGPFSLIIPSILDLTAETIEGQA